MKWSGAIAMSLACAVAGFFGGRISSGAAPAPADSAEVQSPKATGNTSASTTDERDERPSKSGGRDPGGRKTLKPAKPNGNQLVTDLEEIVKSWSNQKVILEDGEEREITLFDLGKLSRIMTAIGRTNEADIALLREIIKAEDDTSEEGEVLGLLVSLPLLGRDIELRGSTVLDEELAKVNEEDDGSIEEILPTMLFSLAKRSPAEAEAWLDTFSKRPDVDDFVLDVDELKATIAKSKQTP